MKELTNEMKKLFYTIEKERMIISLYLKSGYINENDIFSLNNSDYVRSLKKNDDIKEQKLRLIYTYPFLLCDQNYASESIKKILPAFLDYRYSTEMKKLEDNYKFGLCNREEFVTRKSKLKYMYYNSSEDGKNILKTGSCKEIKNRKLVLK